MFQWLRLLPYRNLPVVQASDIFNSLPKSENVRDVCLDCLDSILVTFKPPAFRSRAYCDCNPIRAFEIFDISKEPISKTSRFCMFWYKRCCNWLGAIKGMALWSRGFRAGHFLGLDRNRKPRMKSLWHPGYLLNPTAQATVDNPLAESVLFHPSCAWSSIYSSFVLLLVLIPV